LLKEKASILLTYADGASPKNFGTLAETSDSENAMTGVRYEREMEAKGQRFVLGEHNRKKSTASQGNNPVSSKVSGTPHCLIMKFRMFLRQFHSLFVQIEILILNRSCLQALSQHALDKRNQGFMARLNSQPPPVGRRLARIPEDGQEERVKKSNVTKQKSSGNGPSKENVQPIGKG
jgi:hypothetical protein